MAFALSKESVVMLFFLSSLCFNAVVGEITCEKLPQEICAFSIDSAGRRCVLETSIFHGGYQCATSDVVVERLAGHIESDRCIKACGIDRNTVGISSDFLLEAEFTGKLCTYACFENCPNIVDLYNNLAAGEGALLHDLCAARRSHPRRSMWTLNSGLTASSPAAAKYPKGLQLSSRRAMAEAMAPAPEPSDSDEDDEVAPSPYM